MNFLGKEEGEVGEGEGGKGSLEDESVFLWTGMGICKF